MSPAKEDTTPATTGGFGDLEERIVRRINASDGVQDSAAMGRAIAERIYEETTAEGILAQGEAATAVKGENIKGLPFTIISDITWAKSADKFKDGGLGAFALFTVKMIDTDEEMVVTCGATKVLVQLDHLLALGLLTSDLKMQFFSITAASGFDVLSLVAPK